MCTQTTCSSLPGKYLFCQEHLYRRLILHFFNHINTVLYYIRNINWSGYYVQDIDQQKNKMSFFFQFSTEGVLKIIYLIYKELMKFNSVFLRHGFPGSTADPEVLTLVCTFHPHLLF